MIVFRWFNYLLAAVAFVMSLLNIATGEYALLVATGLFSAACLINALHKGRNYNSVFYFVFGIEFVLLIGFFFISGKPQGFSALWVCLVPTFSMLVFGIKKGSIYSLAAYLLIIFLLWTPVDRSLLQYEYSSAFMLRFPFLYTSLYVLSLFVEYVRRLTYRKLLQVQERYRYLYCHDALTGLYNRYGFNERFAATLDPAKKYTLGIIMLDIDLFKKVNDKYGHDIGDEVLKYMAKVISEATCDEAMCCRWGGEEFNISTVCKHDPVKVAESIRKTVGGSSVTINGIELRFTVSAGVCVARNASPDDIEEAMKQADNRLYYSKEHGRNCVSTIEIDCSKVPAE